jgi:putative pyoverdin transport system ATP-binding/permease protein
MEFFRFFQVESHRPLTPMMVMALVSGAANGVLLAIINVASEHATESEVSLRFFLLFITSLATFVYAKKYVMNEATVLVEQVLQRVRLRITDKIRRTDLRFIEGLGAGDLFTTLSHDTDVISQSAIVLIGAAASISMVLASLAYIAYLSVAAFVITIASISLGIILYGMHRKGLIEDYHLSIKMEGYFFDALGHVLKGFKEIKVNRRRSDDVFRNVTEISQETERVKIRTGLKSTVDYIFSQTFYYTLIGIVIFVMPMVSATHSLVVMRLTAAILFIIGPLDLIVGSFPLLGRSTVAVQNLRRIEAEVDNALSKEVITEIEMGSLFSNFSSIEFVKLGYRYDSSDGQTGFAVGPLNLELRRGDLLFIVGGNGSGKSTFLKTLTGLYAPSSGEVRVDGRVVVSEERSEYRELFSIIFGDFHLFDKFYGLQDVDEKRVAELLDLMQLSHKTKYKDGKFSTVELSTGQKKRLAMITALLEDKPIYVFDEWAADQDPEFKDFFYNKLLLKLKEQGKTVVVVTHDDRYFHLPDKLIKMEYGEIAELRLGGDR